MPMMTGAEALIASLAREGVGIIFGLPGVQLMEALDAIHGQSQVRWVSVRHEQTAVYMAYGYARTTGKVGVALVVPGPGALNATAALGTAYATSTPVLLVSGQVESYNLGQQRGALHEITDQGQVFQPLTKWCHCVLKVEEIPGAVQQAMHHLRTGRPRPVELEIPWDVMPASARVEIPEPEPVPLTQPELTQVQAAARLLASASRPIIWAGGGVIGSDASNELRQVAERLNAPVITTPEGKGAIPGDHPLSLGVFYYRFGPSRWALPQADVILAVGSRLYRTPDSFLTFRQGQKLIQIDVDATEVGRNHTVHLGITSDARAALSSLLEVLPEGSRSGWQPDELEEIREAVMTELEQTAPLQLSLLQTIRAELKEDAILVPGITNVAYWGHLAYPVVRPRAYLTSSYFATLGYAFPTALGVKVGNPKKQVVALSGDGGFMYALPELATAVQEGLNVVTLVFVDRAFGASLHDQQRRFGGRIIGTQLHNPDFVRVSEAFGARGIKLTRPEELGGALQAALAENLPTVVEVPVPTMTTPF
ncbi:MAG: thiamine pyrophosphate-binding protein [Dehalococcoidales bacterium]